MFQDKFDKKKKVDELLGACLLLFIVLSFLGAWSLAWIYWF